MQAILFVLAIAAIFMFGIKQSDNNEDCEVESGVDSAMLEKEISDLYSAMSRLKQLDDMIIDIRLCKPAESQRAFKMEWMSTAGQSHALEFMADGDNISTECLLELAVAEREEVNADIQQRIFDLYRMVSFAEYSQRHYR